MPAGAGSVQPAATAAKRRGQYCGLHCLHLATTSWDDERATPACIFCSIHSTNTSNLQQQALGRAAATLGWKRPAAAGCRTAGPGWVPNPAHSAATPSASRNPASAGASHWLTRAAVLLASLYSRSVCFSCPLSFLSLTFCRYASALAFFFFLWVASRVQVGAHRQVGRQQMHAVAACVVSRASGCCRRLLPAAGDAAAAAAARLCCCCAPAASLQGHQLQVGWWPVLH